jgi:hypothetical protein
MSRKASSSRKLTEFSLNKGKIFAKIEKSATVRGKNVNRSINQCCKEAVLGIRIH